MEAGNCVENVTKSPTMTVPQHLPIVPIIQCNDAPCLDEKQDVNLQLRKSRGKRKFYKFQSLSYGELQSKSENLVEHLVDSQDRNNNNSGNMSANFVKLRHLAVRDRSTAMSDDSDSDIEGSKSRALLVLPRLSISRRRTLGQQALERSQHGMGVEIQNRRHSWIW